MLRCALRQCRKPSIYTQLPWHIRSASYSTSTGGNDAPATPPAGNSGQPYWNPPPLPQFKLREKRSVVIKAWSPFKNMVEVLAVIRAVERKFGTFVEYQAVRDYEMPDKYFGLIFAAFQDPRSFKLVPPGGIDMAVPAPSTSKLKDNEPGRLLGWDDVEKYLEAKDRDPKYIDPLLSGAKASLKGSKRMVHFRVGPAKRELDTPAIYTPKPNPEADRQDALAILEWGKTLPLKPISSERVITDEEISEGSDDLDHVRVRAALRWAACALGVPRPHEIYPSEDESTDRWQEQAMQASRSTTDATLDAKGGVEASRDETPTSKLNALFSRKKPETR